LLGAVTAGPRNRSFLQRTASRQSPAKTGFETQRICWPIDFGSVPPGNGTVGEQDVEAFHNLVMMAFTMARIGNSISGIVVLALSLGGTTVAAQSWTKGLFTTTQHDFGNVARGSRAEYAFELVNNTDSVLHIAAARSSCGCTNPIVPKDTLKPREHGSVNAVLNTIGFTGAKSATITIVIDQPYYAELQLSVRGYIRSDVVLDPAEVNFAEAPQATEQQAQVKLTYAGRSDWRIRDVQSSNEHLQAAVSEQSRGNGQVEYLLTVNLLPTMPVGDFVDFLTLSTDDRNLSSVRVPIRGRILSDLTVSPASVGIGALQSSDRITKRLIVKAEEPFRVIKATSDDPRLSFTGGDRESKLHFIELHFDAAAGSVGKVLSNIQIETDLKGGRTVEIIAAGEVLAE
jgi:hypothetical protein